MTNFSFGRTDGRTERGNNNIPELSLESAGIMNLKNGGICFSLIEYIGRGGSAVG